ncbi:MAG: hypothetical protein B7Z72_11385 [Gemmatimonadetes bacterium 21-71-4]|nr:MAG: hypothetical protein B7Z72_11385 [Gemmatimonadetes bacterium 21-71-4]
MSLLGVPGARAPGLREVPGLDDQRQLVARARSLARRWMVRAVLLLVVSALAVRTGWLIFGLIFLALAVLALQLARSTTRRAAELADKLKRLEGR